MTTNVVTDEQLGHFSRRQHELFERICKGAVPYDAVMIGLQQLIEGKFVMEGIVTYDKVIIPADITAEQLLAGAKATLNKEGIYLKSYDDEYISIIRSDLETVKGKELAVLLRFCDCPTPMARRLQQDEYFDGNAAAFLVWVTKTKRMGWSFSVANADERLLSQKNYLHAPYFFRGEKYPNHCEFGVRRCDDMYDIGNRLWVAFRETD